VLSLFGFSADGERCPAPGWKSRFFVESAIGMSLTKESEAPGEKAEKFLQSEADGWLSVCPTNEAVLYAILRAQELTTSAHNPPKELLDKAIAAAPDSVRIVTLQARTIGSVEAARTAVQLGPKYLPAQIALAAAHENSGNHASALHLLRSLYTLEGVAGGPLLLAKVAFAVGNWRLAVESSKREPQNEGPLVEPVSGILQVGQARLVEAEAWLKLRQSDRALSALLAAMDWGEHDEADKRLRCASPELTRAMERRLGSPRSDDYLRGELSRYLGIARIKGGAIEEGVRFLVRAAVHNVDVLPILIDGGEALRNELGGLRGKGLSAQEQNAVERLWRALSDASRSHQ
jgi:hypothetical protein